MRLLVLTRSRCFSAAVVLMAILGGVRWYAEDGPIVLVIGACAVAAGLLIGLVLRRS